jgi:serine/threonine-protein kinase RsbW
MPQQMRTPETAPSRPTDSASVRLRVPADKHYVVLVRSAAGHLGARVGFTLADVTDLRLAVDEACAFLLQGVPPDVPETGELECRFEETPDGLRVTVSVEGTRPRPDTDGLGWQILSALVDTLSWSHDGTTARVDLVKRRTSREAR